MPGTLTITAAAEVIPEPEPPRAPPEEIIDEPTPQAAPAQPTWALLNLICAILTALTGLGMVLTYFKKKEEDEETVRSVDSGEENGNKRKKSKFFGLIPAIGSIITFILTEDMSGLMTLVDKWTILMVAFVAINAALALLTRNAKEEKEEATTGTV